MGAYLTPGSQNEDVSPDVLESGTDGGVRFTDKGSESFRIAWQRAHFGQENDTLARCRRPSSLAVESASLNPDRAVRKVRQVHPEGRRLQPANPCNLQSKSLCPSKETSRGSLQESIPPSLARRSSANAGRRRLRGIRTRRAFSGLLATLARTESTPGVCLENSPPNHILPQIPQHRKSTPVSSPHTVRTRLWVLAKILTERFKLILHKLIRPPIRPRR